MSRPPHSSPDRGVFIVIEGIDGAGTTTHSKRLCESLGAAGLDARLTCEPTSGQVGSIIRHALRHPDQDQLGWGTIALLFAADRLDHLDREVLPALSEGAIVVSDRYALSSLVYQSATAPPDRASDALDWIWRLNARAVPPDLTIILDVPVEVAARRRAARGAAAELFEYDELQLRLAELYARGEQLMPPDRAQRVVHVDGDSDADSVAARIQTAIRDAGLPIPATALTG